MKDKIKTRFAPSPTGEVHIGNIRTALYCFLFARHSDGEFMLRIEDTDQERLVAGGKEKIMKELKWFGIKWDGDPVVQSGRLTLYKKYALELIESGHAYYCFCSKERLEELRKQQEVAGSPTGYDERCRDLSAEEVISRIANGEPHVIRLKVPETGKISFVDMIRGKVEFDLKTVNDELLLKSDGFPTYHLANVIDDHDMGITHVIRTEEWLSSTPKHILLYQAFGWPVTQYAHPSLVLNPDRTKMSKRSGDVSAASFRDAGYLPEALVNYIVLLGWNPKTDQEFFTLEELINVFEITDVNKSGAVFDREKLDHFNAHYIHQMKDKELLEKVKPFSKIDFSNYASEYLQKVAFVTKTRMVILKDFDVYSHFLFTWEAPEKDMIKFAKSDWQNTITGLEQAIEKLENANDGDWTSIENLNSILLSVVSENELKNGDVFWPVRASLSGEMASPSPTELLWVLGKEESLKRLEKVLEKIK